MGTTFVQRKKPPLLQAHPAPDVGTLLSGQRAGGVQFSCPPAPQQDSCQQCTGCSGEFLQLCPILPCWCGSFQVLTTRYQCLPHGHLGTAGWGEESGFRNRRKLWKRRQSPCLTLPAQQLGLRSNHKGVL